MLKCFIIRRLLGLLGVLLPLFLCALQAATETWDSGGADDNFNTANNWADDSAPASGDDIVFNSGSDGGDNDLVVTINADYNVNSVTFNASTPAMNIDSSVWTNQWILAGGGITNNSTNTQAIGSVDSNASFIELSASSFVDAASGDINFDAGSIDMETYDLTFQGDNDITVQKIEIASGARTITKNGDGTLTIANSISDNGTIALDLNNGTVVLQNWPTDFDTVDVASGATLQHEGGGVSHDAITIRGTGHSNAGAIYFNSTGSMGGDLTLAADSTIKSSTTHTVGQGTSHDLQLSTYTLTLDSASQINFNNVVKGTGTLVKAGSGELIVQNAGELEGNLTVTEGTVTSWAGMFKASSTNTVTMSAGTTFSNGLGESTIETFVLEGNADVDNLDDDTSYTSDVSVTLNATATGTGRSTIGGNNAWDDMMNLNGNDITFTIADNQNTGADANIDLEIQGRIISGSASTLTKNGDGTLYLNFGGFSGADGDVAVVANAGTILYNNQDTTTGYDDGDITVNSGATVATQFAWDDDYFDDDYHFTELITTGSTGVIALGADHNATIDMSSHTSLSLGAVVVGTNTEHDFTGDLTPNSSTYRLGGGGGTLNFTAANTLTGANAVIVDVNGTESSSVVKLSASQDYTGDTTVTGGTLLLGAANVISNSSDIVLNGGTFDTNGLDETVANLTLSANSVIDMGSANSTLNFNAFTYTAGTLSIWNWDGTAGQENGNSEIEFATTFSSNLDKIQFYSDAGSTLLGGGGAMFVNNELVPDLVVPEPSTWFAMTGVLGLCGWHFYRRHRAKAV